MSADDAAAANDLTAIGHRLVTRILSPMKAVFVGKNEIIDLMGVCLAGGENLFLLGPPGTAKSALVLDLGRRLQGRTFEYLLTRFTEPNELFGPFDIRKLREGDLVTNTEGMLPEASLVFLDELLNANSAILNSLLTVLNERVFRRGRETRTLPMVMAVGASNHLPEDEALAALFDRFLLRVHCDSVPDERLADVLAAGWELERQQTPEATDVSLDEIRQLNAGLTGVNLSPVRDALVTLVHRLRQAGIEISDRRAVKLQRLVAASALLCGRGAAHPSDLWVFRYIWDHLEQEEILTSIVDEAIRSGTDDGEPDVATHPRAKQTGAPDPENLQRDLATIETKLTGDDLDEDTRNRLQDNLRILANRCQWVPNDVSRNALLERIDALWGRFEE